MKKPKQDSIVVNVNLDTQTITLKQGRKKLEISSPAQIYSIAQIMEAYAIAWNGGTTPKPRLEIAG